MSSTVFASYADHRRVGSLVCHRTSEKIGSNRKREREPERVGSTVLKVELQENSGNSQIFFPDSVMEIINRSCYKSLTG